MSRFVATASTCRSYGREARLVNPFIAIRVTGSDPSVTDYILESPAKCPNCSDFSSSELDELGARRSFRRGGGGAIDISHRRLIGTRRTSPSLRMMSVEWNANADGSFAADSAVLDLLEPIASGVW